MNSHFENFPRPENSHLKTDHMSHLNLYLALLNIFMFGLNAILDKDTRTAWSLGFLMAMCWAIAEYQLLERA